MTITRRSASRATRAPTRSRRPIASSCARRTPTSTRTIRLPRSASSRSRRPTRCSPIPRSASSTTCWARRACAEPRPAAGSIRAPSTRTASTSPTCSAASSAAAGGAVARAPQPQRGHDLEAGVTISFRDSLNGARVSIAVEALAPCTDLPRLRRGGGDAADHLPGLRGPRRARAGPGILLALAAVPALRRHRSRDRASVPDLRRARLDAAPAPLPVPIPAGIKDGARIRLRGKGEAGIARRARRRPLRAGHRRALAGVHAPRRRSRRRRARELQRGGGGCRDRRARRPTASASA